MQARVGVDEQMEQVGRQILRDYMLDQHRELFARLPYLFLATLDPAGRPWASIVVGRPGFVSSPDARTLVVEARPVPGDELGDRLAIGVPVGVLGIELATRRRNRLNGSVIRKDEKGFAIHVDQSFGNCPKYIQTRSPVAVAARANDGVPNRVTREGAVLSGRAVEIAGKADTLFFASAALGARGGDAAHGVDVSHRGGKPGFVRVVQDGAKSVLTMPDFRGNFLFNTLGNLETNPRAGLLFVDFASGDILSLTGGAKIIWSGPEVDAFAGAERLVSIEVEEGRLIEHAVPLRWSPPGLARELPATGSW